MARTDNKNGRATNVGQLIAGVKKRFPQGSQQLALGGTTITVDDATSKLETFVTNRAAVVAAQAVARRRLDEERAQLPELNAFITTFTAFLRVTCGTQADALADFGLRPPKTREPRTSEQKAVAAAKCKATREARGTKGRKAIQAIKGNVTAKLVVTPAAPED